jgi:choline monooxygenase
VVPPREKIEIDAEIARAWTLPAQVYCDPEVAAAEQEKIFSRTWQIAGRREQAAKPGDYFTTEIAGERLLIVCGNDGVVRGFHNVCRHRAGPPAEGCGSRKVFRCGYHGWTYSLEGKLLHAPEMQGVQNFSPEDFGLLPVACEIWEQWIFVNPDSQAAPLAQELGELRQQVAKFRLAKMRFRERREYRMQCNWKTYIDNYLEGYHLPSVHPGLNRELEYANYKTQQFRRHSVQSSPIRGPENEKDATRRYKSGENLSADYYWIFPNWMLNCYPDNVSLNVVIPLGPEETLAIFEWYFLDELRNTATAREAINFSHEIQLEDGKICEQVQRNLHSRSYHRGRYSVAQERCVHHFHRLYAEDMQAEGREKFASSAAKKNT